MITIEIVDTPNADRMGDGTLRLDDILAFAAHFGFNGLNVTFPYKQAHHYRYLAMLYRVVRQASACASRGARLDPSPGQLAAVELVAVQAGCTTEAAGRFRG